MTLCPPETPPGVEPGRCGGKPATSRLRYGTAKTETNITVTNKQTNGGLGIFLHQLSDYQLLQEANYGHSVALA
jgi:hypothetical protein